MAVHERGGLHLCILMAAAVALARSTYGGGSRLEFTSSSPELTRAFSWAKQQALAYVHDGDPVGRWYEAALPGREAFCMRDVSHQAIGAQALGLAGYTRNMLLHFAASIASSRDWCGFWEINRFNRPPPEDYRDDAHLWYCLPANFDLVDACYRMYRWSGDSSYLKDAGFRDFYRHTASDYLARWQLDPSRIMFRPRLPNIHEPFRPQDILQVYRGNPSYEEARRDFVLGVDLLAAEHAGFASYARILDACGEERSSRAAQMRAEALRRLIESRWWDPGARRFHAFLTSSGAFAGYDDVNVLYWRAVGERSEIAAAVKSLERRARQEPPPNIEVQSHFAEVLYHYGVSDAATMQILDLARPNHPRREYPEVSYSVIGAIVTGLIGVDAVEPSLGSTPEVTTLPMLGGIHSAGIRHLPVRGNVISVEHWHGGSRTRLTNEAGPALLWRPSFRGACRAILVNGRRMVAHPGSDPAGARTCSTDILVPNRGFAEASVL